VPLTYRNQWNIKCSSPKIGESTPRTCLPAASASSNPVFPFELRTAIFISFLAKAAWEDCVIQTRYGDFHLRRGELIVLKPQIAKQYRLPYRTIRRLVQSGERFGKVAIDSSRLPKRGGIVISVLAYEHCQAGADENDDRTDAEALDTDVNDLLASTEQKTQSASPSERRRARSADTIDPTLD
jgi:hypothetical protein